MTRLDHQRLMQLYDGELSSEEVTGFRAELRAGGLEAQAADVVAGFDQVGDVVRALLQSELQHKAHVLDGIADDVLEQIEAEGQTGTQSGSARASVGWGWAAGVCGALALAAAVLLFVWSSTGPIETMGASQVAARGPVGVDPPQEVASVAPQLAAAAEVDPGVAIEMVDFGAHSGTIFMVSSGEEAPTPVVWLVDEGPDSEGRVEQL
jgi:hypothetical protein